MDDYLARIQRSMAAVGLHLALVAQIGTLGPIHGYGLIKAMSDALDAPDGFKGGTVYPILNDLEKAGIVRSKWGTGDTGPRRRYYELTARGRQVLTLASDEWKRFRRSIDSVLSDTGGSP